MLGKLLKHEFRATARIMGPLYLVLIALSICANLSIRILDSSPAAALTVLGAILLAAFGLAVTGTVIVAVALMVNRFRTNLMGDEGYIMFTLPVSVDQLVVSKIIVSTVWFIATAAAVLVSALITAFRIEYVEKAVEMISELIRITPGLQALKGAAVIVEVLVLAVTACASFSLLFYAAMSIGHSFSNHKKLLSVVFFFVIQFVMQTAGSLVILASGTLFKPWFSGDIGIIPSVHRALWLAVLYVLIRGAIYYIVTRIMLKKHLNLE
jgi:hypothetical protein